MVWACCWRSVDTRTYNAARICGSFLSCCHRCRRPPKHQLVGPIPPRLPVRLLAGLPPDLEGAPHGCPSPLPKPQPEGYTRRAPASAAAAATSPDEAGHDGSSRTCHLRSNHRAHRPVRQADARLDDAQAEASRAGRPVDLAGAGRLRPAAPGPPGRRRPAAAVGAAPTAAAAVTAAGTARVSAAAVRTGLTSKYAETRRPLPRPAQGPLLGACRAPPSDQEASHQAQEEAEQDRESHLSGPPSAPSAADLGRRPELSWD